VGLSTLVPYMVLNIMAAILALTLLIFTAIQGSLFHQDLCVSSPEVVFTVVSLQKISSFCQRIFFIYVFPMDF
jgi:hypothetical protein